MLTQRGALRAQHAYVALALGWAAIGCNQESYPIAPTPCDDWCNVMHKDACLSYSAYREMDPASCIADCENNRKPKQPECVPLFVDLIKCIGNIPPGQSCYTDAGESCDDKIQALNNCQIVASYPSAPTPCDDWCNINYKLYSDCYYPAYAYSAIDPAGCVANCNESTMPKKAECVPLFSNLIECMKSIPSGQNCDLDAGQSCNDIQSAVTTCQYSN